MESILPPRIIIYCKIPSVMKLEITQHSTYNVFWLVAKNVGKFCTGGHIMPQKGLLCSELSNYSSLEYVFALYTYSVRVITILENLEALYDVLNAQ